LSARAAPASPPSGPKTLAFTLAAVSGFVDGIGVSTIAGVFPSFMSGNTTGTAVALGTGDLATVGRIGMAIPLYVLAVTVGAWSMTRWPRARPVVWIAVAVLLAGFILVDSVLPPVPEKGFALQSIPILTLLVLPMGLLTMTLRQVAGTTVGLGYVTGTLVSLGESIAARLTRRGVGQKIVLFSGLWVSFFLAAACGGFAVSRVGPWSATVPIVILLALLLASSIQASRR
jgi:uncharacterized membrane protein YoaK (UPF0700 family)